MLDLHGAAWKVQLAPKPKPKARAAAAVGHARVKTTDVGITSGECSAPALDAHLSTALIRRQSGVGAIPVKARSEPGCPGPAAPGEANDR